MDKILTIRWNNRLSLGLGLPALAFVVFAFATGSWAQRSALLWLALIGVLY
jgi:hypothetical protein